MADRLRVGIVGCGLIGERRARVAASDPGSRCVLVHDVDAAAASRVAQSAGARTAGSWQEIARSPELDAVVVATPNGYLCEVATVALAAGKHVLVEKPMGRNLAEARRMADAAERAGRRLKVGFNHRYHPAIADAHRRLVAGEVGDVINIRCRYGHGGRPGYEKEWRGSRELAGGGELTDQGVHVLDLLHWFAGVPTSAFAIVQTAVWPLGDLEDNAFGMFEFPNGGVASFHTSWTQWKNQFSFEVFGTRGALIVEGLGRSYGVETLTRWIRRPEGGAPDAETWRFEGEDDSWQREWSDFLAAVRDGAPMLGDAASGVVVMRMLDALYRSAGARALVPVDA